MSTPKPQPFKVDLPEDLEPVYANVARITHSPSEIIFDLGQIMPNQSGMRVKSRVVMTPLNAKLLLRALGENLAKYEASFGEIIIPGQGDDLARAFFGGTHPPEKR